MEESLHMSIWLAVLAKYVPDHGGKVLGITIALGYYLPARFGIHSPSCVNELEDSKDREGFHNLDYTQVERVKQCATLS